MSPEEEMSALQQKKIAIIGAGNIGRILLERLTLNDAVRAPAHILLNAESEVIWRQDESLNQAERQIELLTGNP